MGGYQWPAKITEPDLLYTWSWAILYQIHIDNILKWLFTQLIPPLGLILKLVYNGMKY